MKEEIKEILDDLRKTADNTIFVVCGSQEELDKMPRYTANFMSINDKKAKQLLDYITNLQEENESLNNIINELEKELLNKIEAVKTLKDMLGENVYVINPHIDLLNQEYNYFLDKLKELKEKE